MPSKGSPDGPLYYSYEVGPAHVMILASFFAFDASSAQYKWIQSDLAAIDRAKTPWVIVLVRAGDDEALLWCCQARYATKSTLRRSYRRFTRRGTIATPPTRTTDSRCARPSSRCSMRPKSMLYCECAALARSRAHRRRGRARPK